MLSISAINALAEAMEGVPVFGCFQGGAADRAGVRYGDVILEVNGVRTKNLDAYIEAAQMDRDHMHLVVFRDGERRSFEFELDDPIEIEDAGRQIVEREMMPTERKRPSRGQA